MLIRSAEFIKSSTSLEQCPKGMNPEFAFIGRSNVGKSSLINMLTGRNRLAKISGTPGKTRTINHFLINTEWYLVDLPGYGYARIAKKLRDKWIEEVERYILVRENLVCLFILIDCRIPPQVSDLKFMEMLGIKQIPIARIFTKSDKVSIDVVTRNILAHNRIMGETWEELPKTFITSAVKKEGREEILDFIDYSINIFKNGL